MPHIVFAIQDINKRKVKGNWVRAAFFKMSDSVHKKCKITSFRILADMSMYYKHDNKYLFRHRSFQLQRCVRGWLFVSCKYYCALPSANLEEFSRCYHIKCSGIIKLCLITFNLLVKLFSFCFLSLRLAQLFFFF